ncbi:MAG: pyrroline-5-carboxylate reductase [Candidatus Hydrogenedentes bacterium]|nr:pyrroline-5-carboxylate reductase [Candidatus Hydrogenedentota bacterium]
MHLDKKLGFLGYGNMGGAMLEGLLELGMITPDSATIYDAAPARMEAAAALGCRIAGSPEALARAAELLILAVKPQQMAGALESIKPGITKDTLVISIAAGVPMSAIQQGLFDWVRVIRVMPNTPYLVHAGAAGIAAGANCTAADIASTRAIFDAIGISVMVDESLMDAVTALSGSGPAYCFYLVECLVEAACQQGLDRTAAEQLAAQTLFGAGKLLAESGESPAVLRQRVTSPGGTTEAALNQFQADGFARIVGRAVDAAANRSRELGK